MSDNSMALDFNFPTHLEKTWKHFLKGRGERWDLLLDDDELDLRREANDDIGPYDSDSMPDRDTPQFKALQRGASIYQELVDGEYQTGMCAGGAGEVGVCVGFEEDGGFRTVTTGPLGIVVIAQYSHVSSGRPMFCSAYRRDAARTDDWSEQLRSRYIGRALDTLEQHAQQSSKLSVTLPTSVSIDEESDPDETARDGGHALEVETLDEEDFVKLKSSIQDHVLGLPVEEPYQSLLDVLLDGEPPADTRRIEIVENNQRQHNAMLSQISDDNDDDDGDDDDGDDGS